MKKFSITAAIASISAFAAGMAHATVEGDGPPVTAVPEISALEGTAALAALTAIVLLTWERRRRAH